mgnify:CR=1 FL=1
MIITEKLAHSGRVHTENRMRIFLEKQEDVVCEFVDLGRKGESVDLVCSCSYKICDCILQKKTKYAIIS